MDRYTTGPWGQVTVHTVIYRNTPAPDRQQRFDHVDREQGPKRSQFRVPRAVADRNRHAIYGARPLSGVVFPDPLGKPFQQAGVTA